MMTQHDSSAKVIQNISGVKIMALFMNDKDMDQMLNEICPKVLDTLDISHIYGKICIPFNEFDEVKIKKGLIPSQRIIKAKSGETKIKLSLVNNTITAKIKNQKQGIQTICEALGHLKIDHILYAFLPHRRL